MQESTWKFHQNKHLMLINKFGKIPLFGKWLWRYPLEQQSLWASVIQSKFGHNSNSWDGTHFSSSSFHSTWKAYPNLYPSSLLTLDSPWAMETKSNFGLIVGPHNLSTCKDGSIACFFSSTSSWDFQFCRNLRDFEIEEFLSL